MKNLNIAMIGYRFMGKADSNAWRQVSRFFDIPFEAVMKVIYGRHEEEVKKAADKFGWQEYATSREQVVERKDIDIVDDKITFVRQSAERLSTPEVKGIAICPARDRHGQAAELQRCQGRIAAQRRALPA
jgi:hypothetical protein